MTRAILFTPLLVVASLVSSEAGPRFEGAVVVRTYNYASIPAEHLAAARLEVAHIFRRAQISVDWNECRVPNATSGSSCIDPLLAGRDLMLRLMERTTARGERVVALGESLLDREQRSGVLMTIDIGPVRAIAAQSGTAMPTLLGRAIAHEIGHLLLRSAEHPRLGLMRAQWSNDELRGLKPAHWGFSSREAAQMRQTLRQLSRIAD